MSRRARLLLRIGGPLLYGLALSAYSERYGVPFAREWMLIWLALGLLAFSLGDLGRFFGSVVADWLPFVLVLILYDLARGVADNLGQPAHVWPQIRADRWLGVGTLPTVWLQRHFWHGRGDLRWWDYAAWAVYVSHFFATLLVAAALWLFARHLYRRFVAMVVVLAVAGFTTYIAFPAAPPWLAARHADIAPVTAITGIVFGHVGVADFGSIFERGRRWSNQVAAVPSLHAAEALLISLFFWVRTRWLRLLLVAYPLAMGFALVYTAEHYGVDILLGWVYALAAFVAVQFVAEHRPDRVPQLALRPVLQRPHFPGGTKPSSTYAHVRFRHPARPIGAAGVPIDPGDGPHGPTASHHVSLRGGGGERDEGAEAQHGACSGGEPPASARPQVGGETDERGRRQQAVAADRFERAH